MKSIFTLLLLSIFMVGNVSALDLKVSLVAETNKVEVGKTARVRAVLSQPVKTFSATDINIDGGRVESLRKINSKNYLIIFRASGDTKEVELQIQADSLTDLQGDVNEEASNLVYISVDNSKQVAAEKEANLKNKKDENERTIANLLNTITNNAKSATPQTVASQVQYYNCNGQAIPTTQQCVQNNNVNYGGNNGVLYLPGNSYGDVYSPYVNSGYGNYVVYPTGLYSNYEISYYDRYYNNYGYYPKTYYTTYYTNYGYYPQSYYSSPFYEVGYGFGSGLRNLLDW